MQAATKTPAAGPSSSSHSNTNLMEKAVAVWTAIELESDAMSRIKSILGLWLVCLVGGFVSARAESLLLTGATVHTVTGETLSPGQVLIQDGKIAAVGKDVAANGVASVNLNGQHLYPGMISLDSVLGLIEIEAVRATADETEVGDYTPDVE